MRLHPSTIRGLRGALLDALVEGPPQDSGERWFCEDLMRFSLDELREEARRLELRSLLTPVRERTDWPARWCTDRLERVQALLRTRHAAGAWSRVRR